jgi:hypothetical protein
MTELVAVDCPRCETETFCMIQAGDAVVGTSADLGASLPGAADARVSTDCHEGHEFVVYLSRPG